MITLICTAILTTFISVNGNVAAVDAESEAYKEYLANAVTDVGNPEALTLTDEETDSQEEDTTQEDTVSAGDTSGTTLVYTDASEMVSLLSDTVELLSENSSTVTGTINTTILDMCDRIIDDYPSHYKYAAFRIDSDDSYRTILYIAKKAKLDGDTITFSDDCIAVNYYRTTISSGYSGYIYYNVTDSPNATVTIGSNSIVYTNVIEGYPVLGNKTPVSYDWLYIVLLVIILIVVLMR